MTSASEPVDGAGAGSTTAGGGATPDPAGRTTGDAVDRPGAPAGDTPASAVVAAPGAVAAIPTQGGTDRPVGGKKSEPVGTAPRREGRTIGFIFLGPALLVLAVLVAWPIVQTVWYAFHDANGEKWVGFHNFATMFSDTTTRRAITNNARSKASE